MELKIMGRVKVRMKSDCASNRLEKPLEQEETEPQRDIQVEVMCEPEMEVKAEMEDSEWIVPNKKGRSDTEQPIPNAQVKTEPTDDDILVPFQLFEGDHQASTLAAPDDAKYDVKYNMVEVTIKEEPLELQLEPAPAPPEPPPQPPEPAAPAPVAAMNWMTLEEKVAATVAAIGEQVAAAEAKAKKEGRRTRSSQSTRSTQSKDQTSTDDQGVKRITPLFKHLSNLRHILDCSNATLIKTRSDLGYECGYCEEKYHEPSDLKTHVLKNHNGVEGAKALGRANGNCFLAKLDITGLHCTVCGDSIDSLEELMQHITVSHSRQLYTDIKNQIIPFKFETEDLQCCICEQIVNTFRNLFQHVMHTHYRNFICEDCDAGFINRDRLLTHRTMHKTGNFECQYCSKVFNTVTKKQYHERNLHTGMRRTQKSKCSYCHLRFRDSAVKDKHLAEAHGVKFTSYICKSCDIEFPTQNALNIHTRRDHLEERKFVCTVCGKGFFVKAGLTLHMVKHTGSKEFQCPICEKAYGRRRTLVVHMRIHTNDRRHMCEHCGMAFVQKSHWRGHMRSQHGEIV